MHITEDEIKNAFVKAVGKLIKDKGNVVDKLKREIKRCENTSDLEKERESLNAEMNDLYKKIQDGVSEHAGSRINQQANNEKYDALRNRYNEMNERVENIKAEIRQRKASVESNRMFLKTFETIDAGMKEFDKNLWTRLVREMVVSKNKKMTVIFKAGIEVKV